MVNILQWNIHGILPYDNNQINKINVLKNVLKKYDIDIILLQEWTVKYRYLISPSDESINVGDDIVYIHFPIELFDGYSVTFRDTNVAIMYKHNLDIYINDEQYDECNYNKKLIKYQYITLNYGGQNINICSYYNSQQSDPLELISIDFPSDNVLFGGDLNLHHELWGDDISNNKSINFVNVLLQSEYNIYKSPYYTHYCKQNGKESVLDVILYNNININNYQVLNDIECSDHHPIIYGLEIESSIPIYHQSWNLRKDKWHIYQFLLDSQLNEIESNDCEDDIEILSKQIVEIIYNAAENSIGKTRYSTKKKPFWNGKIRNKVRELKKLRRKKYKMKRKLKNNYNIYLYEEYNKLCDEIRQKTSKKKKLIKYFKYRNELNINNLIQNSDGENAKKFWRLISNTGKSRRRVLKKLKYNGKDVFDINDQCEILHDQFNDPIKDIEKYNNVHLEHHEYIDDIIDKENEYYIEEKNDDAINKYDYILNNDINYIELNKYIKELENEKSMGFDLIHNLFIKNGTEKLFSYLLKLYNLVLKKGIFPKVWNSANIIPLPKPGRDGIYAKNWRPIALSSVLGKLLEKILAKRLLAYITRNNFIDLHQNGFQINKSCEDAILSLETDIKIGYDNGYQTDVVFTDIAKAYDSVWVNGLLYKMKYQYDIQGEFYYLIKYFLNHRYTRVVLNDHKSSWKKLYRGIPQGSSLSPILFIMMINDFELKNKQYINMALFADDAALWTKPIIDNNKYQYLQMEMERLVNYGKRWKIIFNPDKCKLMKFTRNNSQKKMKKKYYMDGIELEVVKQYKYLGLVMDDQLKYNLHMDRLIASVQCDLYRIYYLKRKKIFLSPITLVKYYKVKIRPKIEYGIIFYENNKYLKQLKLYQNKIIKYIFNNTYSIPIDFMEMILCMEPLDIRIEYLRLKMYTRIRYAKNGTLLNNICYRYNKRMEFIRNRQNKLIQIIGINRKDRNNIKKCNKFFESSTIYKIFKSSEKYNKYIPITKCRDMKYKMMSIIPEYFNILDYRVNINVKEMKPINKGNYVQIFTDGSNDKNPGKSTFGYYNENNGEYKVGYYEYPMNILIAELSAIELAIDELNGNQNIYIYSDSLTSLKMLNNEYYPKDEYTKNIIDRIIIKLNKYCVNNNNYIILNKIKAHSGYRGNEKIDGIVKQNLSNVKYNEENYDEIPYIISKLHIKNIVNKLWKKRWEDRDNNYKYYHIYNHKFTYKINKIIKKLDIYQSEIILKVMVDRLPLNYFKYRFDRIDENDKVEKSKCEKCNIKEDIFHYVIHCEKYKLQRITLWRKLKNIDVEFNNIGNFTFENVVFPYNNLKYDKNKIIKIWIKLIEYIHETKRFDKEIYIRNRIKKIVNNKSNMDYG